MQQHKASEIRLRCCMSTSIIFHCSVVFHHMNVPQFIYPYLRTLKLFPNLANYKQNCSKNFHGSVVKNLPANAGDIGLIPGSGRSPGVGNGSLLQYSCWKIPWTDEPGGVLCSPWSCKESDATGQLSTTTRTHICEKLLCDHMFSFLQGKFPGA